MRHPERRLLHYLQDIHQATERIQKYVADLGDDDFLASDLIQDAVLRNFEIIGEALGRLAKLDPVTTARISNVARIIAFRNVLIHAYDHIDHRLVWRVIQADLPTLLGEIGQLMREEETDVD